MYDGSTAIFEKLKRPNSTQVIAVVGDKIILQVQEQPHRPEPFLSLPGGRCEENEDALESAKRELLEETGYVSNDWTLWREEKPHATMIWTWYTFIARNCTYMQPMKPDAGEKISLRLITFDEFLMLQEEPTFRNKSLQVSLLRARFDPEKKKELHDLFFKQ